MTTSQRFDAAMAKAPLVAVLRGITPSEAVPVADALIEAGFRLLEVPLNSPEPFESIGRLTRHCPPEVLTGAGTVLDPVDVGRLAEIGAPLVVTPNTDPLVIEAALRAGLVPLIGCMTPSEALAAARAGAAVLKIFPAARLGPAYLKDIRAVLPKGARLMPVGGVGLDNMEAFVTAGADGFGFGSNLYRPGQSAGEVGRAARELVAAFERLRHG